MGSTVYGLVIGDSHIHERADEFPEKFTNYFKSKKYDFVIHTGDLIDYDVLEYVKSLASKAYIVQGNMDYINLPEHEMFELFGIMIGVIHGDQVRPRGNIAGLTRIARSLGVVILISGHTHTPFIVFDSGILHINPGSVTGVWGGGGGSMIPSFIELRVLDTKRVYIALYQLENNEIMLAKEESILFA
uniref:Phosphoesterase n=1 Tax=Ignisphaera aggregans TaxID=334771 RepID=A0A7C5YYD6_9CREN